MEPKKLTRPFAEFRKPIGRFLKTIVPSSPSAEPVLGRPEQDPVPVFEVLLRWDSRGHEHRPRDSISQTGPRRRGKGWRPCLLSSQMNAIAAFSARPSGFQPRYPAKMSSRQEQETPRSGLSGTHSMTNVENLSRRTRYCHVR
jgi:hypothetical protein